MAGEGVGEGRPQQAFQRPPRAQEAPQLPFCAGRDPEEGLALDSGASSPPSTLTKEPDVRMCGGGRQEVPLHLWSGRGTGGLQGPIQLSVPRIPPAQ